MDESIFRNLDTQHRLLADLERSLDEALVDKSGSDLEVAATFSPGMAYSEVTAANDGLRDTQNWREVDLHAAMLPVQRERFAAWFDGRRVPWTQEDYLALGFAGIVGAAATIFDKQLDGTVQGRPWVAQRHRSRAGVGG